MEYLWIGLGLSAFVIVNVVVGCRICYRKAFYAPPRKKQEEINLPQGEIYEPYWEDMTTWATTVRNMPFQQFQITSFDGLKLRGRFYEFAPGAPIEIMFHGYRGDSERDMPGGVQRCFKLGRSALLIDQRCAGASEGKTITFGINEHRDCLQWVDYVVNRFGPDVKIILTGISMGASTVLMAAGKPLPAKVIGVIADCGYNSPKEIIQIVIRKMGLPVAPSYPLVKLAARIYGGFKLESYSPMEAVKQATVPIIFIHGQDDDFVPCRMSEQMYEACTARKQLLTIPGAGHGLACLVDPEGYYQALRDFFAEEEAVQ